MTSEETLLNLGQTWIWQGFLVFLRVGAVISVMPGFGETTVPIRVKLGLAIAGTMLVAPLVPLSDQPAWHLPALMQFMVTEPLTGLVFGLGLRLFAIALQAAGSMIAQSTSLSQILGASAEPMPAISHLLLVSGIALAMMAGLHLKFLAYLLHSYALMPGGQLPSSAILAEWGMARIAHSFSLAFQLSAPFVIVSVLYNLAFGAINRAMPQLMVAFVGAPAITATGMIMLALLIPTILLTWSGELQAFLHNPLGVGR